MLDMLKRWLVSIMLVLPFLNLFWDNFPTIVVLYALMTAFSVLFGMGCLRGKGHADAWDRWGVPSAVQKRFARILGILYLVNAAVCPVGLLLNLVLAFDQDFVLLTQMVGFAAVSLSSLLLYRYKAAHG